MAKKIKKIRKKMNKTAKENLTLRGPIRAIMDFYRLLRYKLQTFYIKTNPKTIIFASFAGASYSDNPKALFEYMIKSDRFKDYTFVWGFRDRRYKKKQLLRDMGLDMSDENEEEESDEESNSNIIVVKFGGKKWRKYLAEAKYWVFNYKVPEYLKPKKNQVFLQTWHGTPLKRLGYDLEHFDNALNTEEGIKKRYKVEAEKFDYFVSQSKYATEKFKSAWLLESHDKGNIMLEEGYPRNDILFNYTDELIDELKMKRFGYYYLPYEKQIKKKTIVLYAPTYRSNQHESGVGYTYKEEIDFDKMQRELGDDFIILFRAHYFVASKFDFSKYKGFIYNVSKVQDINDLYLISDVLVTDYSSSMFDFSCLKRPMIFYMYDLDYYRDESNGFYFDPTKELPGPIVKTDDELIEKLKNVKDEFVYDEKYKKFNEKFNPLDDGNASKRIIDRVFGQGEIDIKKEEDELATANKK